MLGGQKNGGRFQLDQMLQPNTSLASQLQLVTFSFFSPIFIRIGSYLVQQLHHQTMVQEESAIDSTTGEEAREEESSYEDAHEGLCFKKTGSQGPWCSRMVL